MIEYEREAAKEARAYDEPEPVERPTQEECEHAIEWLRRGGWRVAPPMTEGDPF